MLKGYVSMNKGEARDTFFTPRAIEVLSRETSLTFTDSSAALKKEQLIEALRGGGYEVLLNGWGSCQIDGDVLDAAPELKVVAYSAGSVAGIASEELYKRGVKLLCGNKIFAKSVAEATVCYMMCSLRKIEYYSSQIRAGGWRGAGFDSAGLFNKKIGIIGYGTIGKYVAGFLKPFETELYIYDKFVPRDVIEKAGRYSTLEEIFGECDIISLHLSKNPGTLGLISRELLEMIKPGALFVNTARGAIIDEAAMTELLAAGRFNAALDVFVKEPLDAASPLRTLPNVLPMPHMAGPTIDMREVVMLELAADITRFLRGEPLEHSVSYEFAMQMTR